MDDMQVKEVQANKPVNYQTINTSNGDHSCEYMSKCVHNDAIMKPTRILVVYTSIRTTIYQKSKAKKYPNIQG